MTLSFLRFFVKRSVRKVFSLGPEEYEERQMITSANSLLACWRSLIALADATVLKEKRNEEPLKEELWRLKWMDHTNQRGRGAVFEVSKVDWPSPCSRLQCERICESFLLLFSAL
jgi:hypothetical protein